MSTSRDFEFLVHGTGVPNADCGSYPVIKIWFTMTFNRTSGENVDWSISNMRWNSTAQGDGKYGYQYQICVLVNGSSFEQILSKPVTTGSNWESSVQVYNASGAFQSTLNTTNVAIYARSSADGGCYHGSAHKPCYTGGDVFNEKHYTCLYDVGLVPIPDYETLYTVHYDANGGSGAPGDDTKSSTGPLQLSSTRPTKSLSVQYVGVTTTSYPQNFNCWHCSADGQYYNPSDWYYLNSGCTMLAVWGVATITPPALPDSAYTVTYHYNGGTGSPAAVSLTRTKLGYSSNSGASAAEYLVGGQYNITVNQVLYPIYKNPILLYSSIPVPTRPGYAFEGWYTDQGLTNKVVGNLVISANTDLYAKWRPVPIHQFKSTGSWEDINPKVYQMKDNHAWLRDRPVYVFNGTSWVNISE